MTRKYNNHIHQTKPRHDEEETHGTDSHITLKAISSVVLSKMIAKLGSASKPFHEMIPSHTHTHTHTHTRTHARTHARARMRARARDGSSDKPLINNNNIITARTRPFIKSAFLYFPIDTASQLIM